MGGLLAIAATVAGFVVAQAGAAPAPTGDLEPGRSGAAVAAVTHAGRSLYLQSCASCHGPQGQGGPSGPALTDSGAAAADFYLRTGRMPLSAPGQRPVPGRPRFSDEEIAALVGFVASLGSGPTIPPVTGGGDVGRGWELFTANCAACHAATGAGNAVGGGNVAVGLTNADPLTISEAMLIGPGVMPRFDLPSGDRAAIIAYVQYLRSAPAPGGVTLGGIGPVAEGFVAIAIALPLLVLVARFVGRRSHEGEPGLLPPRWRR